MKIGLSQLNCHIGNFNENLTSMACEVKKAQEKGVDLLVFSELAICGYPPLDLLEYKDFIDRCNEYIDQFARICTDIGVLVGTPTINTNPAGKKLFNSALFLHEGRIKEAFHKTLLPTYDVFDEYRHFEPNTDFRLLHFKGLKIAITICEDLWYDQPVENDFASSRLYRVNPMEHLSRLKPEIVINMAASPFSYTKIKPKMKIFIDTALKYDVPVIYLNQVGGQTEQIFEGGSLVINRKGRIVKELEYFSSDFSIIDSDELLKDTTRPSHVKEKEAVTMIYHALVLGIKDYFGKMGFQKAIIGLSGGIDSAVTLVLAVDALGPENLHVLLMPSVYSSDHSLTDAKALAENLGVQYDIIPIQTIFDQFSNELMHYFHGLREDITEENIQSRIRSILLMAFANKFRYILLNTSNKSEASVGYGTLYGDMAGGLSVLGDVYKTDVYRLASYINRNEVIIPVNILVKEPSAELKSGQKDSDALPEYEILDRILFDYIELQKPVKEIIIPGDPDLPGLVIKMVNYNEYKRYQTPPILRISSKAFGPGRRMPLVAKY